MLRSEREREGCQVMLLIFVRDDAGGGGEVGWRGRGVVVMVGVLEVYLRSHCEGSVRCEGIYETELGVVEIQGGRDVNISKVVK